jgi:hypothetical protein
MTDFTFPTDFTPVQSYTGNQGCMCGCNGNYRDDPKQVARAYKSMQKRVANGDFDKAGFFDGNGTWAQNVFVDWTTPSGSQRTAVVYSAGK